MWFMGFVVVASVMCSCSADKVEKCGAALESCVKIVCVGRGYLIFQTFKKSVCDCWSELDDCMNDAGCEIGVQTDILKATCKAVGCSYTIDGDNDDRSCGHCPDDYSIDYVNKNCVPNK